MSRVKTVSMVITVSRVTTVYSGIFLPLLSNRKRFTRSRTGSAVPHTRLMKTKPGVCYRMETVFLERKHYCEKFVCRKDEVDTTTKT